MEGLSAILISPNVLQKAGAWRYALHVHDKPILRIALASSVMALISAVPAVKAIVTLVSRVVIVSVSFVFVVRLGTEWLFFVREDMIYSPWH